MFFNAALANQCHLLIRRLQYQTKHKSCGKAKVLLGIIKTCSDEFIQNLNGPLTESNNCANGVGKQMYRF